jgi:circadian clock protein KaiC
MSTGDREDPVLKAETGVTGLDEITGGGLPRGRTSLLVGGTGCGKTILALQFLVHGARELKEPGIFVAFEESPDQIVTNVAGFGWQLPALRDKKLFFMDAQPDPDLHQSGEFDLAGMLSALEAKVRMTGAVRIVFDALDIVLGMLPDGATRRREMRRVHRWLLAQNLTAVITLKADAQGGAVAQKRYGFIQFMVDCAVILRHTVVLGISQRNLRVEKYRGASFHENESPFLIGKNGFDVAVSRSVSRIDPRVTSERVSSGVERLDTMLDGGYYRAASVLITGFPGTAKTTLSGAFAEAACNRGERTLYMSFDSDSNELVRNLASVGIQLGRHVKNKRLSIVSARTITGSAETYLVRIKALANEHRARCVVIDPISALSKSGNELTAHGVAERLMDWAKSEGITMVCTSLIDELSHMSEAGAALHISTLADTWIQLNYLLQAGERNRGLSVIKSRGTSHSNQVRELILSRDGVTLADAYTAGGEVLMGTMRWEKESSERHARETNEVAVTHKRVVLAAEVAELAVRLKSVQVAIAAKEAEEARLLSEIEDNKGQLSQGRSRMRELRGADAAAKPKQRSS